MNERDEIEQRREAPMKKDRQIFKADSGLKSKFRSFRKAPHASSPGSTVDKARLFFRSFDLKRQQNNESLPSTFSYQDTTVHDPPSSLNFIDGPTANHDTLLNPVARLTNISISKSMKVDKINPRDMIVYRVMHNDQDEERLPLNYFRQKYKQYMKPSLLFPKQYYQDLLNKSTRNYSTSFYNRGSSLRTSLPMFSSDSARIYPPKYNASTKDEKVPPRRISQPLRDNPSHVYRPIESSFLVPSSPAQPATPIIRPLPASPSSTLTWNQYVDRLNSEYRSTIHALQQAKDYLEEVYMDPISPVTKCASIVARRINHLSNNETKKVASVTFCLPSPTLSDKLSPSQPKTGIERSRIPSPKAFTKPKRVKPVELNSFSNYEIAPSANENEEKLDSISSIIKKFNDLSNSIAATLEKCQINEKTTRASPLSPIFNHPSDQTDSRLLEEETTYTIETFYQRAENPSSLPNVPPLIVTRENTTAEQFDSVYEQQQQQQSETSPHLIIPSEKVLLDETTLPSIHAKRPPSQSSSSSNNTPVVPPKSTYNFVSRIPKRTTSTMHGARLQTPSRPIFSSCKFSSSPDATNANSLPQFASTSTKQRSTDDSHGNPSVSTADSTPTIRKNYVKSIVRQLNTNVSAPSTVSVPSNTKRIFRRMPLKPTTFTNPNAL